MVKNSNIVIDFKDTGVGIAPENLSKIFDPLNGTNKKGIGLSLAVSYRIIKKLNGAMTVESEPGKGTRFLITLPYFATSDDAVAENRH
jgi:signal transduction histidine kinase